VRTAGNTRHGAGNSVRKLAAVGAIAAIGVLAGCRQDMHNQPKFIPQRGTDFFADGRSARPQMENTVARGQLRQNVYFYTGMQNGKEGDAMPFPVTQQVLDRGQERYNVYCTPCHSRVGNGEGLIVMRGYRPAGNFHTPRLMAAPLGHFFYVMTNGYGAMPEYASQIAPQDRWAIVAYIKALQLSQHAQESDAPSGAQFEPIQNIAEREGLPADMAKEWKMPPTAVYGTPDNQDNGIPQLANPNEKNVIGQPAPRAMEKPQTPAGPNKQ
jgi:mono/diheme cytochrome c family protein